LIRGFAGFDAPWVLYVGLPASCLAAFGLFLRLRRSSLWKALAVAALRAACLLTLSGLLARPLFLERDDEGRRTIALLLDTSRSMSLVEGGQTRFDRARAFAKEQLMPSLAKENWKVEPYLFSVEASPVTPVQMSHATPIGGRTDLGVAIAHAVYSLAPPPLALIALTDGVATESTGNSAAVSALLASRTPFIGVGFGNDQGVPTLSLQRLLAPSLVPPHQAFQIMAQLQAVSSGEIPPFEVVLLKDGQFKASKRVEASHGSRLWTESFQTTEDQEGLHEYAVQVQPPPSLVCPKDRAGTRVQIANEREFRILFLQGALTWDFKFIGRALRKDPSVRLTGLSRTSKQSVFRQNVETAGELLEGFPEELSKVAPYRVIVLSEVKAADLSPAHQEVIARFCGELGGGVLLIGGRATFDSSWQGSRLEQLLPVTFDATPGVLGLDRPFHLRLTDEALRSPVFRITEDASDASAWAKLPAFTHYGRILSEKPGATVWATHEEDVGPKGRRILMASQSYGAGLSAVIAVESFWRWRLAKEADAQQFDRFWQQLFRFLGQSGRQDVSIQFPDQEFRPHSEVRALVERRPRPEALAKGPHGSSGDGFLVRVKGPKASPLEQKIDLIPLRPVQIHFRAEDEGIYTLTVENQAGQLLSEPIEIKDTDKEMERTGRDMENLKQWAALSGGLALAVEECREPGRLLGEIKDRLLKLKKARTRPAALRGDVLVFVLGCLCGEWLLRRTWGLR